MATKKPFHFTDAMTLLCSDITRRLDDFSHIRMDKVVVTFAQARSSTSYGLQARLTPLRFENGSLTTRRGRTTWTVQRLYRQRREMLYMLTFYLPRFQNQTYREKLITVVHELYHISPRFDGDLRRMHGRYYAHSHSQAEYDRLMEQYVEQYLALRPPARLLEFLRVKFNTLGRRHGSVVGVQVPVPKMIPLETKKSA